MRGIAVAIAMLAASARAQAPGGIVGGHPPFQSHWPSPEEAPPGEAVPAEQQPESARGEAEARAAQGLRAWRGAIGLEAAGMADGASGAGVVTASMDLYLQPLVEDPNRPLALMTFDQHPDTVSILVGNTVAGLGGAAGIGAFPWGDTGILVSLGGRDEPGFSRVSAALLLALQRYFRRDVRGWLGWSDNRSWAPTENDTYDGVRGGLAWQVGRALLSGSFDVGLSQEATPAGGSISNEFFRRGTLAVTGYFTHRWSASLHGGVKAWGSGATSAAWVGLSTELYLTTSMYLVAGYELTSHSFPPGAVFRPWATFVDTSPWVNMAWLSATWRL